MSTLKAEYRTPSGQVIQVRQGDLTQEETDAIVNAANSELAHGGGVAGAIVRRGGQSIQEESNRWVREHGSVPTGQVAVTGAGSLPARYVIHAVGPVWRDGKHDEDALLRSAVWNSLLKAHELQLTSIALPAISSGIFGFPKDRCAAILVRTALDFCTQYPDSPLREIRFTNIDSLTVDLLVNALQEQQEGTG
ncbi:MAG: macro domain-containing protein [Nitrospinota bacterium]|nr:MAG: macro domain-containing protein [Nitrospinota bacterium]